MANEIANQFNGLPMNALIGAPLQAACEAQVMMAKATVDFINEIGFITTYKDGNENIIDKKEVRNIKFEYQQNIPQQTNEGIINILQDMEINVPLLSIVNIPALSVKKVDITFDMEVKSAVEEKKSSDESTGLNAGGGLFGWGVKIKGNVSAHQESTRKTDNSAKYHIEVHAADEGMPEGLSRVLDIMQTIIQPVAKPQANTNKDADSK
ncbi:DUF2589 domain-containing protein [Pectobacterium versatile]|uniref:DUF2589 domain-containing protein n=1 Tax=Pectobacterium versatile TaxID=2488639 RepID=UPI001CCB85A9|nr:DUF2589 domain-containing protein [Pectobacterium versatile]